MTNTDPTIIGKYEIIRVTGGYGILDRATGERVNPWWTYRRHDDAAAFARRLEKAEEEDKR